MHDVKVHTGPLTAAECAAHVRDGRLEVVVQIAFGDVVAAMGIDDVNDMVADFFPALLLSDISYEVVGFAPPPPGDSDWVRGDLHVKVRADVEEF